MPFQDPNPNCGLQTPQDCDSPHNAISEVLWIKFWYKTTQCNIELLWINVDLKSVAPAHCWRLPLQHVCLAPLLANGIPRHEHLWQEIRFTETRHHTLSNFSSLSHNLWTVPPACKNMQHFRFLVFWHLLFQLHAKFHENVRSPSLHSEWIAKLEAEVEWTICRVPSMLQSIVSENGCLIWYNMYFCLYLETFGWLRSILTLAGASSSTFCSRSRVIAPFTTL